MRLTSCIALTLGSTVDGVSSTPHLSQRHSCRYIRGTTRRIVWDEAKEAINLRKHRVSFKLARLVFFDPFALIEQDRIENGEMRWQTLGVANGVTLLLVAHTVRDEEDGTETIRIISARRAEPRERRRYEEEPRHNV